MGLFNPSSPNLRGQEWRPKAIRSVLLDSPGRGVMLRFYNENLTIDQVDVWFSRVVGNPGYGFEILTSGVPPVLQTAQYAPTTDTGKNTTGWEDQAAGAANFGEISDASATTFHRNSGVVPAGLPIYNEFRLGGVVTTANQRFLRLRVYADVACTAGTAYVRGVVNIGGARYFTTPALVQTTSPLRIDRVFFDFGANNPATLLPWTAADIEAFDSGADEIGIEMQGVYSSVQPGQSFRLYEMGAELTFLRDGDNRAYYSYGTAVGGGITYGGWAEKAMTLRAAPGATVPLWLHIFNWYKADSGNFLQVPILKDPDYPPEVLSGSVYTPSRNVWETTVGPGGAILESRVQQGELLGALFHTTGSPAIMLASQPYVDLVTAYLPEWFTLLGLTGFGQSITTAASTSYAGVVVPVGSGVFATAPDGNLTISVHSGTPGGTVVATAVIRPTDLGIFDGQHHDVFARFLDPTTGQPANVTLGATTKYYVLFTTTANLGRGWKVVIGDTRSDLLGTGISTAEVEGASSGGTTDAYYDGADHTRYDIPMAFVVPPTAPAGVTATLTAEVCEITPNRVRVAWSPTSLAANFGGYNVYRRPARAAAEKPDLVATIRVGVQENATRVEAQHAKFDDFTTGVSWQGGQWEYGWEYAVTVLDGLRNIESDYSTWTTPVVPVATNATRWWITSNDRPYLCAFVPAARAFTGTDQQRLRRSTLAGRDLQTTRTQVELPGREYKLSIDEFSGLGEDPLRVFRELAATGLPVTLIGPEGDRIIGTLDAPSNIDRMAGGHRVGVDVALVETRRDAPPAEFDLPAGLVLNGTSQHIIVPSHALLNPGTADFTIVVAAVFAGSGSSRYALSKGNLGTGDGYGFRTTGVANVLQFFVDGATTSGGPFEASAVWFDGFLHVAGGGYTSGAQDLYRDGVLTGAASVAAGTITNSVALLLGANNGGTPASWMAAAPIVSAAVYLRKLTAAEHLAAASYLRGINGYRMPAKPSFFVDLRDRRTWQTGLESTVHDLSGNNIHGTVIGSPSLRGRPWPLADLERY